MRLITVAAAALQHFSEETGQPLDCVHSGSLKIARRTEDAEVIHADIARGRRLGMDVEQITLAERIVSTRFFRLKVSRRSCALATTCISTPHRSPWASHAVLKRGG